MIIIVLAALFISVIALEVFLVRRWRGWWRALASLPLAALIAWAAVIVVATIQDPTSHNLWPLELMIWCVGALIALGLIALAKRIAVSCRGR